MRTNLKNIITKKFILGLFVCMFIFLAPISILLDPSSSAVSFHPAVSHAKDWFSLDELWNSVGAIILAIPSAFLWVGGTLLDTSLEKLVFGMGDYVNTTMKVSINNAWTLVRDIANLAFIFGFVYIGIRTIIDPDSASTKRFLSKIIIGALLINFSLFFVKFIVDFANFTAYQIYIAMINGSGTLSATVADRLGIITFFSSPGSPETFGKLTGGGTMLWFFVLASVLLFIVAFVFTAAALLLITRFVGIVLIMVGSPILFAATVFPQTEHYASEMWKKLISYAFFAPVFLLLVLISLKLIEGVSGVSTGDGFTKAFTSSVSNANSRVGFLGVTLNFAIVTFFFIQSLLIAQKMGVAGGDAAVSLGNKVRAQGQRYLGNATFGAAAGLSRATVGNLAHHISEKDNLREAASRRGLRGVAARQALKASRAVGDASFDARNVNGLGNAIGAGEGRKGGYKTVLGEIEKKEKEFATSLGEVGDDDVRVEARKKEWEAAQRTQKAESVRLREDMKQATTTTDRAKIQSDIDALEKKEKEAHNDYEKEKQRRIVGSTFANESRDEDVKLKVKNYEHAVTGKKDSIKELWKDYTELPKEANKMEALENIKRLKDELDDLKKKQRKFLNEQEDQGYASVLESSKHITAWPVGRLVTHEQEAGKAIRKSAEKGLPKKKDD